MSAMSLALLVCILVWMDSLWVVLLSTFTYLHLDRQRNRYTSLKEGEPTRRFLVLVPLWQETDILDSMYQRFHTAFAKRKDCRVVFITSIEEAPADRRQGLIRWRRGKPEDVQLLGNTTPELMYALQDREIEAGRWPDTFTVVLNRSTEEHGKYSQLNAAMEAFSSELAMKDYVAVYDADTQPDAMALDYIQLDEGPAEAFQTMPHYLPTKVRNGFEGRVAQAKFLVNFHFFMAREAPLYFLSASSWHRRGKFRLPLHLIGHGQFIRKDVLVRCGGFRPPSCDSTLGFSLGLLGYTIQVLPVLNRATTPPSLSAAFWQGVVWYNGIRLISREQRRLSTEVGEYAVGGLLRWWDNLRWFAFPLVVLVALLVTALIQHQAGWFFPATLLGYLLRDAWGWALFSRISRWSSFHYSDDLKGWGWMSYAVLHAVFTRFFWTLPPLYVHAHEVLKKSVPLRKTSR